MMNATDRVQLADEPGFRLGAVQVEQAARQIEGPDGIVHTLQPKAMQLLVALNRFEGRTVPRERLMEICWGPRIVGEDSLDRMLGQLRKVSADTGNAFAIETVRGVGLRLLVAEGRAVPAAPPAAADIVEPRQGARRSAWAQPRRAAFGLAVLVALGAGLWSIRTGPGPSATPAQSPASEIAFSDRLAVLPFRTLSSGPDDDLLAGGMTEEVTQAVATLPGVRVIARSSSEAALKAGLSMDESARALGADYVVEGAVRRAGTQIRVSARLVQTPDGTVLWSSVWERDATETFDVASLIATEVARNLEVVLDPTARAAMAKRGITNVEAFTPSNGVGANSGWRITRMHPPYFAGLRRPIAHLMSP